MQPRLFLVIRINGGDSMTVKKFRISVFPPKTPIADVIGPKGDVLDSICTKCTTEEECSTTGDYTLDAEFVNGNPLSD